MFKLTSPSIIEYKWNDVLVISYPIKKEEYHNVQKYGKHNHVSIDNLPKCSKQIFTI